MSRFISDEAIQLKAKFALANLIRDEAPIQTKTKNQNIHRVCRDSFATKRFN